MTDFRPDRTSVLQTRRPRPELPGEKCLTDRGGIPFGTCQHRFIDWARDLGFLERAGVETRAAKDVADFVANPPRPLGQGRGDAGRRGRPGEASGPGSSSE